MSFQIYAAYSEPLSDATLFFAFITHSLHVPEVCLAEHEEDPKLFLTSLYVVHWAALLVHCRKELSSNQGPFFVEFACSGV